MSLVEQELFTLLEDLISSPVISGVRGARSLVLCVMFLSFLDIVLSDLLRFTDFDYPFVVLKLFLHGKNVILCFASVWMESGMIMDAHFLLIVQSTCVFIVYIGKHYKVRICLTLLYGFQA